MLVRHLDGPLIMSWRPVFVDGHWQFTANIASPSEVPCKSIISLLRDEGSSECHGAVVDGTIVATTIALWAGYTISHGFFGSQSRVGTSLGHMQGCAQGYFGDSQCMIRDPESGLVVKFETSTEVPAAQYVPDSQPCSWLHFQYIQPLPN